MKEKGFTLIELLAVFAILAIILAIAVPGISGMVKSSTMRSFESDAKMILKAIEFKKLNNEGFNETAINKDNIDELLGLSNANYESVVITLEENLKIVTIVGTGKWEGLVACGSYRNIKVVDNLDECTDDVIPPLLTVTGDAIVRIYEGDSYADAGATATDNRDGDITSSISAISNVNVSVPGKYTVTYTVSDNVGNEVNATRTVYVEYSTYSITKSINKPILAPGMTPIKWDGSMWITTTEVDNDWYDYTLTDKKWANAKTTDGSMWVWIPRYAYQIASGYHTNTTGTIEIKFLKGPSDISVDESVVSSLPSYNGSNQTNYVVQPAFRFGNSEVTGIWVAKFEPTAAEGVATITGACNAADNVTTKTLKIVPNVNSWRCITIGNAFTAVRNMETNSVYGWGTSGTGIDTHMMKNVEWGAIVYLAKSAYGKTNEIWINPSDNYTTGCAGDSLSSSATTGCLRTYSTTQGFEASTTGNITGIYDISGSAWEFTAAHIDGTNLSAYGSSIEGASDKYRDKYVLTVDNAATNYANSVSKYGDAIYETSSSTGGNNGWNSDGTYMPYLTSPWFLRGGIFSLASSAGSFYFNTSDGNPSYNDGFRPVLLVSEGL